MCARNFLPRTAQRVVAILPLLVVVITPTSAVLSKKFLVHHISKLFVSQLGANWEFLLLNIAFGRGVQIAKKNFPPKNLIYIFWRENISYSQFLSPYFTADTVVLDTRCLCHCCCLRILEPGGLELLNLGLLGCRLNCGMFWWIMSSWNLNRKLSPSSRRWSVSNLWSCGY